MMRLAGCACFVLAGVLAGRYRSLALLKRRREQEGWLSQLILLKGGIQYGQTSLPELFKKLGKNQGTRVELFFYQMGERLADSRGTTAFYQIWQEEVEDLARELKLDLEPVLDMGSHLGSLDRQTELNNLERYLETLNRQLDRERLDFAGRRKLVQALCTCAGMALAIVFW